MKNEYYNFFRRIIDSFIYLFIVFSILSTLYVFTYSFENNSIKIFIFIFFLFIFFGFIFFFKKKIKNVVSKILSNFKKIDYKKMILIIVFSLIILKIVYSVFFYFDPTLKENDISIYNNIANKIVETNSIDSNEISHLLGIAIHLSIFKLLNIPNDIGIFIVFSIGTVVNFISFSKLIGKEKSFLVIMTYIIMPSTMLLTFCPTHELFVYLYLSLSMFMLNNLLVEESLIKQVLETILLIIFIILTCFVNPAGNLVNIILGLVILLTNVKLNKKIFVCIALVLSLFSSNLITKSLNINETLTETNTISILICGSSIETNGEHVDYYPAHKAKELLSNKGIQYNAKTQLEAYKEILIQQYKYLFTHPIDFIKLLAHKFYIEWSGDHYSIEMAYDSNAISQIEFYAMLAISTLIYLSMLTIGIISGPNKDNNVLSKNYYLLVLGIVALLLVTLVLNKYSVYATIFIYFVVLHMFNINEDMHE